MRILQLIPNISGGGAERLVVDLCNKLSIDNEVVLLTLYDPREKDMFRKELSNAVTSFSLGKTLGFDWKIVPRLYKTIQKINPEVIHNHLLSFNYLMPLIPLLDKVPIIHTIHNDAFKECPNKKNRKVRRFFFKRRNVVPVTISKESAQSFVEAYKNIGNKLIYNGRTYPEKSKKYGKVVDEINRYKLNKTTKVFINIGRIIPQKNQLMLVKAFNRLVYEHNANAILIIIGGSRETKESYQIQQELNEAAQENKYIFILGERLNATDYLHGAHFFCLSSIYEGMPITLIEAFATGCIPVCTPVGGIPEMVGDEGFISKSVNVEDFYDAISKAYKNKKSYDVINKFKFRNIFSINICAKKYEQLYSSIV